MKKGVWVAALALGLGGSLAGAVGQEAVWRAANRPADAVTARGVSPARPGAVLGKPVPITRGASPDPRPFPEAYRVDPPSLRGARGGVEPIATVAPPGSVIAASASSLAQPAHSPIPEESQELVPVGDLFATDRAAPSPFKLTAAIATAPPVKQLPAPAPVPALPRVAEAGKNGSWIETFPTFPAAPKPGPKPGPGPHTEVIFGEELPPTKWYVRGDYLLWWTKNDSVPPLVTTTTLTQPFLNPNNSAIGALGQPETVTLFGGELDRNPFSGARLIAGYYLDDCGEKAIEFTGFFLGQRSATFVSDSFTTAVLTRPFTQANAPMREVVERISFPNEAVGKVTVKAPSYLWGLEPNLLCKWCCGCDYRVDLLAGFRYLNLRESLTVEENIIFDSNLMAVDERGVSLAGATNFVKDRFAVLNQFFGGQVGIEGRWQRDRLTVDGRAKIGLGVTNQQLSVEGFQVVHTRPDNATTGYVGGLLALPSNIGDRERDVFSVVPEVGVTVGYYLTDRFRATVGYNFLYWSHVVRPGDQIDPVLNVNQIPNFGKLPDNPDRPAALFKSTDFWAHGITAGFEFRY